MKTLEKLVGSACFALTLAMSSPAAAAVNYQDWWLNPLIIGAGVNIQTERPILPKRMPGRSHSYRNCG
jgi:hypothetical protein